jgi:hypothetical protein
MYEPKYWMVKMIAAAPSTISGTGTGISRLSAAPIPPRSAAASMMLPVKASATIGISTQRGN